LFTAISSSQSMQKPQGPGGGGTAAGRNRAAAPPAAPAAPSLQQQRQAYYTKLVKSGASPHEINQLMQWKFGAAQ
jgi:hypothetical protein